MLLSYKKNEELKVFSRHKARRRTCPRKRGHLITMTSTGYENERQVIDKLTLSGPNPNKLSSSDILVPVGHVLHSVVGRQLPWSCIALTLSWKVG